MGGTSAKVGSSARFELISSFALASQSSFVSINRNKRPMKMKKNHSKKCVVMGKKSRSATRQITIMNSLTETKEFDKLKVIKNTQGQS